jgi:hypothetical protein
MISSHDQLCSFAGRGPEPAAWLMAKEPRSGDNNRCARIHEYKCSSELALGEWSKRRLLELMNAGPFEVVRSGSRDADKYGCKLRDIVRGGSADTTLGANPPSRRLASYRVLSFSKIFVNMSFGHGTNSLAGCCGTGCLSPRNPDNPAKAMVLASRFPAPT